MTEQPVVTTYLWFHNPSEAYMTATAEERKKRWPEVGLEGVLKIAEKHGFKVLFAGNAYGADYMAVLAVQGQKDIRQFGSFISELRTGGWAGLTRTITVTEPRS